MWTWEKILKCKEIKRGVLVESKCCRISDSVVLIKTDDRLIISDGLNKHVRSKNSEYPDFKFFHTTGEEILPTKERETITLYETLFEFGDVGMCDENGFHPNFGTKQMVNMDNKYIKIRKANINKNKSVVLYADTFEVKEWRN